MPTIRKRAATRGRVTIGYEKTELAAAVNGASDSSGVVEVSLSAEVGVRAKKAGGRGGGRGGVAKAAAPAKEEEFSGDGADAKVAKWEPPNWRRVYDNIREMRKNYDAPVDDMGCERCADDTAGAKVFRFHTLVALMLSSQTKDQVTHAAMERLKANKLSVGMILEAQEEQIQSLIYPVGFYKRKTVYLKQVAKMLREQYDEDIPDSVEGLCKLPGVGPKMAYLCMQCAWNTNSGIGVDTHVHRIANRLGWLKKEPKTPEDTRKGLEDWLPNELWREVNWMLVGFGQTICTPLRPKCDSCLNQSICPVGLKAAKEGHSSSPKKSAKPPAKSK